LWISSPSALIKINPKRNQTFIYGRKYGISQNSLLGGVFKKADGEILVSNKNGFYSFYPNELSVNNPPAAINITDIFINTQPLYNGKENQPGKSIEELNELSLAFNQNNISIYCHRLPRRSLLNITPNFMGTIRCGTKPALSKALTFLMFLQGNILSG
jgi:hypothetical protein